MKIISCSLVALILIIISGGVHAHAEIHVQTEAELAQAVKTAPTGEVIILMEGAYDVTDLKLPRDVQLIGRGEVKFQSATPVAKGLLNPLPGASVRIENIEFSGARAPDKNGAGVRHDGDNLTLVNCAFSNNENGVLATGAPDGEIIIKNSTFTENGHGDGYSHGVYVVRAATLTIENSRFLATKAGHHVKSLARRTHITKSRFDDAGADTSYALDASGGGEVSFTNNIVTQGVRAGNPTLINYDLTRGGEAQALIITDNIINNHHPRGKLLRNATPLIPVVQNNIINTLNKGAIVYKTSGAIASLPTLPLSVGPVSVGPVSATSVAQPHEGPIKGILTPEPHAPKKAKRTGTLHAPVFTGDENALARIIVENNTQSPTDAPITFGVAFKQGALRDGDPVSIRFGEALQAAAQLDVKARHADGSVRHAALTLDTPELAPGEKLEGAVIKAPAQPAPDFDAAAIIKERYDFPLALTFYFKDESTTEFSVNARKLLLEALSKGLQPEWLNGALTKEYRVETHAADHLKLRFDIRVYADGEIRTSVVFDNSKSFTPGLRHNVYDVRIGDTASPVFSAARIGHHRASRWRRIYWTNAQPRAHVIHDLNGLVRNGAVLPLDPSVGVDALAIAEEADALRDSPPLAPANIDMYFPRPGGRPDLGIYPQWVSQYLVAQTPAALEVMLDNAEAGGAVPWHFSDEQKGAPVSIEDHPKFWADERGLEEQYAPDRPHPDIFSSSDGDWTPDHSHKPDLFFVPYLVTADHHYADELAMQAAWAIFGRWPYLREGGLKAIDVEQVRASAWSLRDISNAAWALPETHPSKAYLARTLEQNLSQMHDKYVVRRVMRDTGELEGYLEEDVYGEPTRITPWMNDYVVLALWLAARRGSDDAAALMAWTENFHTARVLSPDFPADFANAYRFPARGAQTQGPVDRWSILADKIRNSPDAIANETAGYPDLAYGYVASGQSALTALASATHSANSITALAQALRRNRRAKMWEPYAPGGVRRHNNFFFALNTPDGATIARDHISFGRSGGDKSEFIIGDDGADRLAGGAGDDFLVGLGGDDELDGGPGADTLLLNGASGKLTGGAGSDRFIISANARRKDAVGDIVITDFNPSEDSFELNGYGAANTKALIDAAAPAPAGTLLELPQNGAKIYFQGVSPAAFLHANLAATQ